MGFPVSLIEQKILPHVTKDNLRMDLMDTVRDLALRQKFKCQWSNMSNDEILKDAGLWGKDYLSGEEGYNLACILLFGKDETIKEFCPDYSTSAIYHGKTSEQLQISTNLIETYDILMDFIVRHTSDKICFINYSEASLRDILVKAVISNMIVHRDYASVYPARVLIDEDWLRVENGCIPIDQGKMENYVPSPYSNNPLIMQFFMNIGRADNIGMGIKNLYKYTPIYSDEGNPEFMKDSVFRVSIPLRKEVKAIQ